MSSSNPASKLTSNTSWSPSDTGVPLDDKAYMFGDSQSFITSGTIHHSSLDKRHNALAYHRVREAIASDVIWFFHISGKINPADVLTKFLGHVTLWPLIKPFLFWRGQPSPVKTQSLF
jgi:hypothetical protein